MSANLLKRLADAGTPMDLIMEVAETLAEAKAAERVLEKRREKDRLRKRNSAESVESSESAESAERVSLDKEKPPTPPKEINPFPCVHTARAKGWHRLPENWEPRPLPSPVLAKVDQWPPGTLGDELANFRRWAANAEDKNGKGRKLDWDQAWRNWIGRRHDERYSRNPANTNLPGVGKTTAAIAGLGGFDDHSPM